MKIHLGNQEHGYRDYDITGCGDIYRAKVLFNIKNGEIFSIYRGTSRKEGCIWKNDLETSLENHLRKPFSV